MTFSWSRLLAFCKGRSLTSVSEQVFKMFKIFQCVENPDIVKIVIFCYHKWKRTKELRGSFLIEELRCLMFEFMAWHISGVDSCKLTFPLKSLSFFSMTVLRMFWCTTIICVCFSTTMETSPKSVWKLALPWWTLIRLLLIVFRISPKILGILVYQSEFTVPRCSSGTVATWPVLQKKQVTICFEVIFPQTTFVEFGLGSKIHTVDCCFFRAHTHRYMILHLWRSYKQTSLEA